MLNDYFYQQGHFSHDMEHEIITRWLANPNQGRNHLPDNVWKSHEYLIHCQNGDSCAC